MPGPSLSVSKDGEETKYVLPINCLFFRSIKIFQNIILEGMQRIFWQDPVKDSSISFTWIIVAAMSSIKEFCNIYIFWNVPFVC